MADSTCVIHPFSYTSPEFSNETHQENPMYGVEESVSFGRFMSENLSWEKWSSFNNNRNRYVEEAEKYSRPGSVAQKKAYFEAHFKRMAALKAAALLEQQANANANANANATQNMSEGSTNDQGDVQKLMSNDVIKTNDNKIVEKEKGNKDAGFVVHQNELYSVGGEDEVVEAKNVKEIDLVMQDRSSNQNDVYSAGVMDENCNASKKGLRGMNQMDKPSLQNLGQQRTSLVEESPAAIVKRNRPLSSYMSPIHGIGRASLFASSPARSTAASVHPGKENYATPIKQKSSLDNPDKKRTPLRASINRELNKIISPVMRKIGSSSKASKDCSTPLRTPAKDSVNGVPEPPPLTPDLAKRGARSHLGSSDGESKMPGPRWHILSTDGFKSPSTSRTKISSPIIPTSFCMSGERAARRKQKLEEKFNATTTERAPQPSKFKEKAEAELNKFRQSFCFKTMSSPEYNREFEAQKSPKQKGESTCRASPRRGRQLQTSNTSQNKSSLPPRRPAVKPGSSKNVQQKNY